MEVKFVGHGPFIGGLEAIYKVKRTQKLEKFMQSFGKAVGFPWENLRFMMVPEMVWYDTILQELGITDSEIEIDVFHGQPQDFSHLLWSGLYSDTVIKVEGQTIKCHMPLLTQFSQVFSEMATAESICLQKQSGCCLTGSTASGSSLTSWTWPRDSSRQLKSSKCWT